MISFDTKSLKGGVMRGFSIGRGSVAGGVISQGQGVGSLSSGERSDSGGSERGKKRGKK